MPQLQAEREAAAGAAEEGGAGAAPKRGRGRPVGSKTKNHSADPGMTVAATSEEAARRMLAHRKLTSKINYTALADLFADAQPGAQGQPCPSSRAGFITMYFGPSTPCTTVHTLKVLQQACGQMPSQWNYPLFFGPHS